MKSRRPRSRALFAIASIALLSSACSAFNPLSDVQTKKVAVDLAFGAKVDEDKVTPEDPLRPLPTSMPTLDPPKPPPPPPPPVEGDICPPPTAIAPKYLAPPSIKDGKFDPENPETSGNIPGDGDQFLFFFAGNRANEEYRETFGYKTIDAVGSDAYAGGAYNGVHYRVRNPVNQINMWFSVVPDTEATSARGANEDGLFLRRIELPPKGAGPQDDSLQFSPASAETTGGLRLLHFPIQAGHTYEDQSQDIATKEGQDVPGVGTVFPQSSNTLKSSVSIGKTEIIPVCDQLAQAWKVSFEISSTGLYRWQMVGTFWMGTHIGGWPLKSDFVLFSEDDKLVSGNFYENMARLDPGDYI